MGRDSESHPWATFMVMNLWMLQCSPQVWDVFSWWADGDGDFDSWTISRHLEEIDAGDRFVLWVGGDNAGVYAIGAVTGSANFTQMTGDPYWKKPPKGAVHAVPLTVERYLFDVPITKATLAADPDFSDATILRMPRTGNPIRMTDRQWDAVMRHVPKDGPTPNPPSQRKPGEVVVTSRSVSTVVESTVVTTKATETTRRHRENGLVLRYAEQLGRNLEVLSVRLDNRTLLVADAFDRETNTLIEAKASTDRIDVRMAIGQLFDYQRHLAPDAHLAVLLPRLPSNDLVALLEQLGIEILTVNG
jgi:hypothetical protein